MSHYFTNEQLDSNIQKKSTRICGTDFYFLTDLGVFSKEKLDFGTRLLLESLPLSLISGNVLDVGCGYGPIGIFVRKKTARTKVTMCDVNRRALHLAEMNCKENGVSDIEVLESDCYSGLDTNKKFDVIITNPPIRAGKKVVYEIVMNAKEHLVKNGKLFLVIRKEQGAKSLLQDLEKIYSVTIIEKSKGFFIIQCNFD